MKTLTLKNVPDELYARLGRAAKASRRSLNQHVIVQLEASFENIGGKDMDDELAELDEFRKRLGFIALDTDITKAKHEGRP